jgi:hypothetical protein
MPAHRYFSRATILAATDVLAQVHETDFDRLYDEWGLFVQSGRSIYNPEGRSRSLAKFLLQHPDHTTPDGEDLAEAVVTRAIALLHSTRLLDLLVREAGQRFVSALQRDGFAVENGHLVRMLAVPIDVRAIDDEVHALLDRFGFKTAKGHLEQAAKNHHSGNWASANSQIRTFFVSLLDEIAFKLEPAGAAAAGAEENRRQLLAHRNPPFLLTGLNEWSADGKNFINGVVKRLHPQGAHPGLSDDEDCTFRLQLVLLVARLLLRRL